jgi:hypothetical protein
LLDVGATHRRPKEAIVVQKRMYKVLTPIPKRDGTGSWFMRIGNGFTNKDNSINLYLDVIPVGIQPGKGMTLTVKELDENDLRQREAHRANAPLSYPPSGAAGPAGSIGSGSPVAASASASASSPGGGGGPSLGGGQAIPF